MNSSLFSYIDACKTPFQAVEHTANILAAAGYTYLSESGSWELIPGGKYYVTRNGSSIIAFRVPKGAPAGFMMTAAHCDSPAFKIKENSELVDGHYVRLSVEKYGGLLMATWMDRPLAVAGRITVRTERGMETRCVELPDTVVIPNVAIHMNRKANDGFTINPAVDMLPLVGLNEKKGEDEPQRVTLREKAAAAAGVAVEDVITTDLYVYNPQSGSEWNGLVSAPRLDDLQCAFACLRGFMEAEETDAVPVCCIFDNEEVGSRTKQGAAGTFLKDVLNRVAEALGLTPSQYRQAVANSFLVSCDNAHAVHPNHPEYADKNHSVYMNGGIVIKYNANQSYTSDAVSAALFKLVCDEAGVPTQYYANRADLAGGGTLGNIANTQVSLNTVDIGLAQLAMHSCYETAGAEDTEHMVRALTRFYSKTLTMERDGVYSLR